MKALANTFIAINNLVNETVNLFLLGPISPLVSTIAGQPLDLRVPSLELFTPDNLDQEAAMFTTNVGLAMGASSGVNGLARLLRGASSPSIGVQFAQKGVASTFRFGDFAGRTVDDVAGGLRNGTISPNQLPVRIIVRDGVTYTINNRSLMALRKAGLNPTVVVNVTGDAQLEAQLTKRLAELKGKAGPGFVPVIRERK